ncbi:MogA/MoaB family molybdenum cofactor biosynthesis protein [Halobacillus sp. H74]|uniref:MogA/MoaB family molybdenum cofactor biosynthesis protein n=1 Tax=Halobacillus sp. H74 TaxID=3457436 RepID=UPI003FCE1559
MSLEHLKTHLRDPIGCMVLTVSDSRNEETDKSGQLMIEMLKAQGNELVHYNIITDDKQEIQKWVKAGKKHPEVEAILLNGGTGIAGRDVTIESLSELLEKEMPGFGELFRMLSYNEDIGSAAILSRAMAGSIANTAVFSTPGSSGAVKLAMERLILPELPHVVHELKKDQ